MTAGNHPGRNCAGFDRNRQIAPFHLMNHGPSFPTLVGLTRLRPRCPNGGWLWGAVGPVSGGKCNSLRRHAETSRSQRESSGSRDVVIIHRVVGSVPLLHPELQTVDEMLDGWRNQQRAATHHDTIARRVRLVPRFVEHTNEFPWMWDAGSGGGVFR
jgi:hypothetical protein